MKGFNWERNWGKATDESVSDKRRDLIFEYLKKAVLGHYPILNKIAHREKDVERLKELGTQKLNTELMELTVTLTEKERKEAQDKIAQRERDIERLKGLDAQELKNMSAKLTEDFEPTAFERARIIEAAINASEYPDSEISDILQYRYNDWDAEYGFKRDFENFLWDIAYQRHYLREELFPDDNVYENVGCYLGNPSWHSPIITDFLLVDIFDAELLLLEKDFHFGLFPPRLADQMLGSGLFLPVIMPETVFSWRLPPKERKKRDKWRVKYLGIGLVSLYIWKGEWKSEKMIDLLLNDYPSWVIGIVAGIAIFSLSRAILSVLIEIIYRNMKVNKRVTEAAAKFAIIRFEIAEQPYHAETLIDRLKKLEDLNLVVSSLIYALLELRKEQ